VRVALLLTGCVEGIRNTIADYLGRFTNVRKRLNVMHVFDFNDSCLIMIGYTQYNWLL